MKQLIWYLFAGTRGGETRLKIVCILHDRPFNANELSKKMGMDYKTITHHIRVLEKNSVIYSSSKGSYGQMYFISEYFKTQWDILMQIKERIERNEKRLKVRVRSR